ncbi:hypothetical protein [Tepidimonas alkaliphilus]|uniref:hypothetical protein n=1 Tax=Tepidimonas alkaliphilus TaxID=2588942 RepID=UPI00117F20B6|nr:hypothetical protein [Tepidimonas alkaliphilus]
MPLFAALVQGLFGKLFAFLAAYVGRQWAMRIAVAMSVATGYVALVAAFNAFVSPLLSKLFATSWGHVLGLAFPPISGTVIAGLVGLWIAKVSFEYSLHLAGIMGK